jgi:hypothetical protein
MRGEFQDQGGLFSYIRPEERIPSGHPLRKVRELVREVLKGLKKVKPLRSDEHFSVDGTLIEAWASHKSFKPKDGDKDDDGSKFHGQRRKNDTHASTSDPDAKFYRKAAARRRRDRRITVGEDKAYDTRDHAAALRRMNVTPHVARYDAVSKAGWRRTSAIDRRTTRHTGYRISQSCRAMVERILTALWAPVRVLDPRSVVRLSFRFPALRTRLVGVPRSGPQ